MMKPPLLSVARARAELTAGIPGQCAVTVRVLDDVTLRIHGGELLLVQAPEALGQSMLLAALAGGEHSSRHRYVRSVRDPAPGLRIRRAALHLEAVWNIVRGWQEANHAFNVSASRTLYLLRATRPCTLGGALTLREAAEWRRWGRHAHERRDGVVIACPPLDIGHVYARQGPAASSAHEPTATYDQRDVIHDARAVRLLELRAGRLHDVRASRWYDRDAVRLTAGPTPHRSSAHGSNASHAPTACHPSPTTLPAP